MLRFCASEHTLKKKKKKLAIVEVDVYLRKSVHWVNAVIFQSWLWNYLRWPIYFINSIDNT